ncbi:unnamed protein product, partial [Prorocentrum cordatum]
AVSPAKVLRKRAPSWPDGWVEPGDVDFHQTREALQANDRLLLAFRRPCPPFDLSSHVATSTEKLDEESVHGFWVAHGAPTAGALGQ